MGIQTKKFPSSWANFIQLILFAYSTSKGGKIKEINLQNHPYMYLVGQEEQDSTFSQIASLMHVITSYIWMNAQENSIQESNYFIEN